MELKSDMSNKIRREIKKEVEKLCKSIPSNIQSGAREVAEDEKIAEVCHKYGYDLPSFYDTDSKNCTLNYVHYE